MPGHFGAVSLRKSHDIVILSFCNIVKGQANCINEFLGQEKKSTACLNRLRKITLKYAQPEHRGVQGEPWPILQGHR